MTNTSYNRRRSRSKFAIAKNNKDSRPVVKVFRSNKNLYLSLVLSKGNTLCSVSSLSINSSDKITGKEKALIVGEMFTKECIKNNIKKVVFDKGAYSYSGKVKLLADSCRSFGLEF
jgi:ribosomal protein L18